MALTVTTPVAEPLGLACHFRKVAFDSSYPTGGEALTAADLGFEDAAANLIVHVPMKSGYMFEYDGTNAKIKAYYGDNNNASDGPLIEVPNTTDLSALTDVLVIAYGFQPTV